MDESMAGSKTQVDPAIGYWSAVSIGIGGMVGGGIFAVLGLAAQLGRGGTSLSFAVAGLVALLTSYSYAKLSVTFPTRGGTVEFLNRAFGQGVFSGGLNVLLILSYIVMLSLYAVAFGSYGASFFPESSQSVWKHVLISTAVLSLTGLNVAGAAVVGRFEEVIVGFKVAILLLFVGVGVWSVNFHHLEPATWPSPPVLIAGGMIIFLAYEGFELIANTAEDVRNAAQTLPRAYYSAVGFVIILYVLVSLVTVGNLSIDQIVSARDYALAESAKPFLGSFGFVLIAVAALLSTGSAINATLYGAARTSYVIAKEGELPEALERKVWHRPVEGLLIMSGATLLVANLFDLSRISMMGSAGFLLIFAAVNVANVRLASRTGSRSWVSLLAAVLCLAALSILVWNRITTSFAEVWVLVAMVVLAFGLEAAYRKLTGRSIRASFMRGS